ncbi:T9SS type A sorting domain-containing protein [Flavobacteriales bacterium]|nr:T9SS type A sorting domain-containing protein [Flavobacteriales bacterium]
MKFRIISALIFMSYQIGYAQVGDTLGYTEFMFGTPTLYQSPNGGYAFGTNGYHDMAIAQSYSNENSFVLREVLLQFGAVNFASGDSSSSITVNVYDNYGYGTTSFGSTDSIAPDSILGSVEIPIYQLSDDGSLTSASFLHDTLVIFSRFSVGVEYGNMNSADTVGVISTTDGDALDSFDAWELSSNDDWFTVEEGAFSWGLGVDFAIFPVIDENDPAGIADFGVNEISVFPNPTTDILYLPILKHSIKTVVIYNNLGGEVNRTKLDGSVRSFDVSSLVPGVYQITVKDDRLISTAKFIKL